jgi:hypothetical protein
MSLSDIGIWLVLGVLSLGIVALVYRFMLRPGIRFFATLAGGAWHGRADLNPTSRPGSWRLLAMACFLVAFLLGLEAKGAGVLDSILALVGIEIPGFGRDGGQHFRPDGRSADFRYLRRSLPDPRQTFRSASSFSGACRRHAAARFVFALIWR